MKHFTIRIEGRVQGVFFRDSAKRKADELGIVGWVRNEPDGSVAIEAEGEGKALEEFITWCRRGPPGAKVERVNSTESKQEEALRTFTIRR